MIYFTGKSAHHIEQQSQCDSTSRSVSKRYLKVSFEKAEIAKVVVGEHEQFTKKSINMATKWRAF